MDTQATGGGVEVTGSTSDAARPDLEVRRDDEPPVVVPAPPASRSGRLSTGPIAVAAVVVLLLVGLGAVWLLRGGDDDVATTPAPGANKPAVPAALTVQVDPPTGAVAGQPATLVVHYSDGAGVYSGSTEDWGDGVGAGSGKQGQCDPTAAAAGPASGSYEATHTWSAPGTYTVAIEVTSYTCKGGTAVEEHASTTVQVDVAAG
jgi:hypothetical protein